jgi:hypothetical protein
MTVFTFQAINFNLFIRHQNFLGELDFPSEELDPDFSFSLEPRDPFDRT